jgi:hypothetical protein
MRRWGFLTLWVVATFTIVWLLTAYSWSTSHRMPTSTDIALYFVALPSALLSIFWLSSQAWEFAINSAKAKSEPGADSPLNAKSENLDITAERERGLAIAILASAIRTVHGDSADDLSTILKANEATLNLDPELKNQEGFPILTGRINNVDEDGQRDTLLNWLMVTGRAEVSWTNEQLRAIAIGSEVVTELAQEVVSHPLLEAYVNAHPDLKSAENLPMLQLIILMPQSWDNGIRSLVCDWFSHLIQEKGWPLEKIALVPQTKYSYTQGVTAIDRLMVDTFRQSQQCYGVLIACESHIGSASIENWESKGQLFTGKNEMSFLPGEGAAGLLLADEQQLKSNDAFQASKLNRVVQESMSKSADEAGKANHDLLAEMTETALQLSGVKAEQITLVTSDTDHRVNRMRELLNVGYQIFPDLDFNEQCFKVVNSCGMLGSVASVAALALAHHEVINNSGFVVSISNLDSHARTVGVVSPWNNIPSTESLNT